MQNKIRIRSRAAGFLTYDSLICCCFPFLINMSSPTKFIIGLSIKSKFFELIFQLVSDLC